jgi:hypothetical protein
MRCKGFGKSVAIDLDFSESGDVVCFNNGRCNVWLIVEKIGTTVKAMPLTPVQVTAKEDDGLFTLGLRPGIGVLGWHTHVNDKRRWFEDA